MINTALKGATSGSGVCKYCIQMLVTYVVTELKRPLEKYEVVQILLM
jgi:hypothetical protein